MNLIKQQLHQELVAVIQKLHPGANTALADISYPPEHRGADYASSAPLRLTKTLGKNPSEIAEAYIAELEKSTFVSGACQLVAQERGFINFFLRESFTQKALNEFLKKGSAGFLQNTGEKKQKILNEFISANPTGPMTMGNARGAFLGDILSRILRTVGHRVENEYYVNNAKTSKQIQKLGETLLGRGESYLTPWLNDIMKNVREKRKIPLAPAEAGYLLAQTVQHHNRAVVEKKLGIHFDRWFEEDVLYENGEVRHALETLREKNLVYEQEGALWCRTTGFGDDEDRVLVRSDGESTYFLADITYHLNKYRRGYDQMVDIWGADHQGHVKRLHAALKALGHDSNKVYIIITQLVRFWDKGELARMSKRAGTYVTLEKLIDTVGIDVARYFFLMRSPETHIDFDLALAKERSEKNPVYYIQYAYVRALNILKKAGGAWWKKRVFRNDVHFSGEEKSLAIKIVRLPELLYDISKNFQAHQITSFAHEFAREFHNFYERSPVLSETHRPLREMRLALCAAAARALAEQLDIMGISKPKKM